MDISLGQPQKNLSEQTSSKKSGRFGSLNILSIFVGISGIICFIFGNIIPLPPGYDNYGDPVYLPVVLLAVIAMLSFGFMTIISIFTIKKNSKHNRKMLIMGIIGVIVFGYMFVGCIISILVSIGILN